MKEKLQNMLKTLAKGCACLGLLTASLGVFLLAYCYMSGDHQDRAEMQATARYVMKKLPSNTAYAGDRAPASFEQ